VPELCDAWLRGYRRVLRCRAGRGGDSDVRTVAAAAARGMDRIAWICRCRAAARIRIHDGELRAAEQYLSQFARRQGCLPRSPAVRRGHRGDPRDRQGIAAVFAAWGANVLIVGRDENAAREAARELSGRGLLRDRRCVTLDGCTDIRGHRAATLWAHRRRVRQCRIFPTVAARSHRRRYDTMFATNIRGTIHTVQACITDMATTDGAGIVVKHRRLPGRSPASRAGPALRAPVSAAQLGFVRNAAIRAGAQTIIPSMPCCPAISIPRAGGNGEQYLESMLASIPMRRLARSKRSAITALFLATDEASLHKPGQTIVRRRRGRCCPKHWAA